MSKDKCRYGEFEYPEKFGFSGSAGKSHVKAYVRGGPVRKPKMPKAQDLDLPMEPLIKMGGLSRLK